MLSVGVREKVIIAGLLAGPGDLFTRNQGRHAEYPPPLGRWAVFCHTIMLPDLLELADEIRGRWTIVARDLHEVRRLMQSL